MATRTGPVIFETLNDEYLTSARIGAILWEGATSIGDTVELQDPVDSTVLWGARTNTTHTYLGANIGPAGIHAPNGFKATTLAAGRILVYLREG